jgi:hypothetical protein
MASRETLLVFLVLGISNGKVSMEKKLVGLIIILLSPAMMVWLKEITLSCF